MRLTSVLREPEPATLPSCQSAPLTEQEPCRYDRCCQRAEVRQPRMPRITKDVIVIAPVEGSGTVAGVALSGFTLIRLLTSTGFLTPGGPSRRLTKNPCSLDASLKAPTISPIPLTPSALVPNVAPGTVGLGPGAEASPSVAGCAQHLIPARFIYRQVRRAANVLWFRLTKEITRQDIVGLRLPLKKCWKR